MRGFDGRSLILAAALMLTGTACRAGSLAPSHLSASLLPNGLRVVIKQGPAELTCIALWVRAGASAESDATGGSSYLLQRLLIAPASGRGFPRAVETWGGRYGADTSRDWVHLTATVPSRALPDLLARLQSLLLSPDFSSKAFERERAVALNQVEMLQRDPRFQLPRLLARKLFAKHPYKLSPTGTPDSLRKITRPALRRFFETWFVPANMSLVVVTDLPAGAVQNHIARTLGRLPRRPRPLLLHPAESPLKAVSRADVSIPAGPRQEKGRTLGLAFRGPGVMSADVYAMDILLGLLGEGPGSLLNRRLPKEGLAREVNTEFLTQRDPGYFLILTDLLPAADPRVAEGAILSEIERVVREGPEEEDLRRAREWVARSYQLENETPAGQSGALGFYEAIDTYRFAVSYLDKIAKVPPEAVRRVARTYLQAPYAAIVFEVR